MQWLMLVSTFIVMAMLQRLARGGPVEARATLALGFLMLAAYLGGTIAQRLRVPRIVGFLLVGFFAGPAWLALVRPDEVEALSPIANGALALIAFAAGSRINLAALRGVGRTQRVAILRVAAGAMAVPFVAVTLVVLTVGPWFPLTAHQPFRDVLAVALALGTMAAVASPVLTWAVITDVGAGAKGTLSDMILRVTIVQDVAAVLLLIVVLALAQALASGGAVTPGVALIALVRLGGSIVAGGAVGLALAQYLRAIRTRTVWALVAVGFVAAQAVRLVELDAVLMALAAGFVLRNAAPDEGARLDLELERCALPVYVVFFALAGCSLDFAGLAGMWPWALLLIGLRASGLRWGVRWAGRNPAVDPELAKYGWLGLISQGGLAITLAGLLRRAFPEWNVSLESLLVAMIGVHQVAGPLSLQWALRRTAEVTEGAHGPELSSAVGDRTALVVGDDSGRGL